MKNLYKLLWGMMLLCFCLLTGCSDEDEKIGAASIKVTGFTPEQGLPGTEVTITGSGFGNQAKVYFNDSEVTDYVSRSDNTIVVLIPDNASSGRLGILDGEAFGFSVSEFTFIPSAVIVGYSEEKAPVGATITINGRNFFDIPQENIIVKFGNAVATVVSANSTTIVVVIPEGAESGPVTVQFGDIQTVGGPEFTVGAVTVVVPDYFFNLSKFEKGGGSYGIGDDGVIGSTKNGAYLVYPFTVEANGNYIVGAQTATNQGYACYLNIDMGIDMDELAERVPNNDLSQVMLKQGWATWENHSYGTFYLKSGQQYYLRVYFLAEGTSWAGNVGNVVLKYAEDQETPGINVGAIASYNLYANNFNNGEYLMPFSPAWAWDPCYIKVINQYAEFYFNQAALDADNRRERRGCELACNFTTTSEGWYGFKIFLPEGKFPKSVTGSIIAQIFNGGNANTWAGHLKIDNDKLMIAYRGSAAASAEVDKEVGTLEWNKWIPVVVYFKAGRNNKGNIRVWMGDIVSEETPTFDSGNINFAFGGWIDDNTLDDTDRESDGYKGSSLGCKFGLYVGSGGDRTIRFDDLKALEGNPIGAFNIVKP